MAGHTEGQCQPALRPGGRAREGAIPDVRDPADSMWRRRGGPAGLRRRLQPPALSQLRPQTSPGRGAAGCPTAAHRAVSTAERGSSGTARFDAACTQRQTAGNLRGPLVTLVKETSATFTQFWGAGRESGSLRHRQKGRMHPFLLPWEALKISLANLTLKGP